jgi:hypothetical protein
VHPYAEGESFGRVSKTPPDTRVSSGLRERMAGRHLERGHPTSNLPVALTSFIGREAEMAEIKRLLAATRLLTITGAGGAGKTRLALQVASEVVEQFSDGVWLVDLGPLFDATLVPRTVAATLGVPEQPEAPIFATLKGYLRERRLLLILDNCEHLIGASAELAEALLRSCPDVCILATSREALGIAGESVWRAPSLSAPGLGESASVERLRAYEAVQLFEARAAAVRSEFRVTAENAAAGAQICHRLDGIPLAIELAAAHEGAPGRATGRQTGRPVPSADRREPDGAPSTADASRGDGLELRPAFGAGAGAAATALRFAGGSTLEAAETICAGGVIESSDVLDLLARLVDKSLVVVEPRAWRPATGCSRQCGSLRATGWSSRGRRPRFAGGTGTGTWRSPSAISRQDTSRCGTQRYSSGSSTTTRISAPRWNGARPSKPGRNRGCDLPAPSRSSGTTVGTTRRGGDG